MKNRNIILFSIVLVLLVVAVLSLSNNIMSPYVSFKYAVRNQGSYVQIIGMRDKSKPVEYKDKRGRRRLHDGEPYRAGTLEFQSRRPYRAAGEI